MPPSTYQWEGIERLEVISQPTEALSCETKLELRAGLASPSSIISRKQIVAKDSVDGVEAVFPIHFLAFAVGAAVVGNADFVNPALGFGQFGRHFGFECKTIFTEVEIF